MSGPSPLALAHRLVADQKWSEAAILFGKAAEETEDAGAKKTLKALQAQNERKALDAARRLRQQQQAEAMSTPTAAAHRSFSTTPTPKGSHKHRSRGSELRKELSTPPPPFALPAASSLSSSGAPPSVSPRGSASLIRQAAERARTQRHLEISKIDDGQGSNQGAAGSSSGSGLGASSSWSHGAESSYLFPPRERSDPFQRFWGVVEGMLEDYSNPVAFASAPLGSVYDPRTGPSGYTTSKALRRSITTPAKLEQQRRAPQKLSDEQHDSFYIVSPQSSAASSFGSLDDFPSSSKTPEELQLENMSLRLSLDKLASHTHTLEQRLAALSPTSASTRAATTAKPDGRAALGVSPTAACVPDAGPAMPPVDLGRLKKEVEKVWRGEESRVLEMSRVLQAQTSGKTGSAADQQRIQELEKQVAALKDESTKQRETIVKYKERFERIKVGARKKRDERGKEEGQSTAFEDLEGEGEA